MLIDSAALSKGVDAANADMAELRQRIQALPDDPADVDAPAARASLGRAFAAGGRTARELRAQKLALGHGATRATCLFQVVCDWLKNWGRLTD
jgi:hypothetical protein